jgi:hypothetical protein
VLYNKSNTEIEEKLLSISRIPNVDTLLIYYAGHGHRTDLKKLYLIAKNTKKIDDYILGGVDFDFINQVVLKPSPAKQKILIIDACHSGIATQGTDTLVPDIEVKGTYILTSSPGDEVSYFDKKARNTYFTGSLIELLKSGIDNTNEMLALDDLYEYSKTFLSTKQFPSPISRSQLNIPASQFYIARNPLFSIDKLKLRPAQLYQQGKFHDALYEYELLVQQYPDDVVLRKEAERCRSQVLFSQLIHDGDELFYQHQNYSSALEKYRKAYRIIPDENLRNKIVKCEEKAYANPSASLSSDQKHRIEQEDSGRPTTMKIEPAKGDTSLQDKAVRTDPIKAKEIPSPVNQTPFVVAIVWAIIASLMILSGYKLEMPWYLFPAIILVVSACALTIRKNRMGNLELILYSFPALIALFSFAGYIVYYAKIVGIPLLALAAFLYMRLIKKRMESLHIGHVLFACVPLVYYCVKAVALLFVHLADDLYYAGTTYAQGTRIGLIVGLVLASDLIISWFRRHKSAIQRSKTLP